MSEELKKEERNKLERQAHERVKRAFEILVNDKKKMKLLATLTFIIPKLTIEELGALNEMDKIKEENAKYEARHETLKELFKDIFDLIEVYNNVGLTLGFKNLAESKGLTKEEIEELKP